MSCEAWEKEILLAQSGELPLPRAARLKEHLAGCPACAAFSKDSGALLLAAREHAACREPDARLVANIVNRARQAAPPRPILFRRPVQQALAYAALLLLALGAWMLVWDTEGPQNRVEEIGSLVAAVTEHDFEVREEETPAAREAELRALARQLLLMQGMSVDGLFSGEPDQGPDPDAADAPTASRDRSNAAYPA